MQTSKNHFEAKVIFNDETIRRMFRTEFYTYEGACNARTGARQACLRHRSQLFVR